MIRRPPRSTRTETLFPYTTLFRSLTLKKHWAFGRNRILQFHVPESSRQAELGPNDFDLIVSDDSPDLRLNPRMWPTLACRIRPPDEGWEHQRHLLQVQMDGNVFGDELVQTLLQSTGPASWYIDRAFNDVNTTKAAAFLAEMRQEEHH